MPKKPKPREDYQQIARRILDTIAPDAEPTTSTSELSWADNRHAMNVPPSMMAAKTQRPTTTAVEFNGL